VTKTVPTSGRGTGVAGFKEKAKGVSPPSNPDRRGVFLTDVIVELGFADQKRVDAVVEAARSSAKTVEELLLEHGDVDENQLSLAIAEHNGLDHVDLARFEVDTSATEKITRSMGLRHRAVPIAFACDGALIIAVADPFDSMTICDIEEMTGCVVRLAIARPMAIDRLLERLPGGSPAQGGSTQPQVDSKPKHKVLRKEAPEVDEAEEDAVKPDPLPKAATREEEDEEDPDQTDTGKLRIDGSSESPREQAVAAPEAEAKGALDSLSMKLGAMRARKRKPEAPAASNGDEDLERAARRAQMVEGELVVARRQIADLKRHVAEQGLSPELERKNAELGRRTGELERRIAELEVQEGELEAEKAELEAQNGQFERQNAELKLKMTELDQWLSEVVSVAEEATRMTAKLDALRKAIDESRG
jgi:hypothetical protein